MPIKLLRKSAFVCLRKCLRKSGMVDASARKLQMELACSEDRGLTRPRTTGSPQRTFQ